MRAILKNLLIDGHILFMAFTSISWKGIGVIANCNALSDSAGGTWAELGGGGISANTDNPLVPPASIGHVYASKSGYGYYTTPATYNFDTGGNAEGQLIYIMIQIQSASAFDALVNNGFALVVGTDTNNHKYFQLAGSGVGEGKLFEGGGWKLFVIDPTKVGSIADKGTFDITTINMIGLWIDTIVSVRADTIFIGSVAIGSGIQVTGNGTLQEIVDYCTDYTTRAWPVCRKEGRVASIYGSITAGNNVNATINTELTDDGTVAEFRYTEYWDGSAWALSHPLGYNSLDLEKHVSYTTDYTSNNTTLMSNAEAKLSMSSETGTTKSLTGGSLDIMSTFNTISTEITKDKVLTDIDTSSISNTPEGCTWNTSGLITMQVGGGLNACTISKSTGVIALTTANPSAVYDCPFISVGTGHAMEATSTGTYNWENTNSGYGADGTTDAVVYNNSGGHINLNVIGNGTTPTVRNGTAATTTVISGTVTVQVLITAGGSPLVGASVYVTKVTGGAIVLSGVTDTNGVIEDTGYTYTADEALTGRARYSKEAVYKTGNLSGTITSAGATITQSLILD